MSCKNHSKKQSWYVEKYLSKVDHQFEHNMTLEFKCSLKGFQSETSFPIQF
jgi:hypothetical protein